MTCSKALADLVQAIAADRDPSSALESLAKSTLELTQSRNVMLAVLNDELALMELLYGAGPEWQPISELGVKVDINERDGIVATVAATGEPYLSGDVQKDQRYRKLFDSTESEIAFPIRDRHGRIVAVLNAESDKREAYTDLHFETCRVMAGLAAMILDRAEQEQMEEALMLVGNALDSALSESELVSRVMKVAKEVLRFQACSIFIWDSATSSYVLRASVGSLEGMVGEISYLPGEGCTGWACETGQPVLLNHPSENPRWRGKYVEFASDQIASFLAVPVVGRSRTLGVIRVLRKKSQNEYLDNRFTETDLAVLHAISEQVATGLESIRAMNRLVHSERMVAWGELSAKSSHMIGNRVFALRGDVNELGHLLNQNSPNPEELKEVQTSLVTNVDRLTEILQDFRDFVSATQLTKTASDLNRLVAETANEVFPKRGPIRLKMNLDEGLPMAEADPVRLRRAVSELIENALNWIDEGELRIETGQATEGELVAGKLPRHRPFLKIAVEDDGPGVAQDQKEAIFEPFRSGRVKGMGLGLSIVKGIAQAHGGTAIECGEEGVGARFVILLPSQIRHNTER
ncbi:MAG: GAF domain-containing protein [Armatimonadetes bacterium]|nr:GAF domain-containing protein [Armatimonadota bacterium]